MKTHDFRLICVQGSWVKLEFEGKSLKSYRELMQFPIGFQRFSFKLQFYPTSLHANRSKIMSFQYFFKFFDFLESSTHLVSSLRFLGSPGHYGKNGSGLTAKIHDFCTYCGFYNRVFIWGVLNLRKLMCVRL